MSRRDHVWPGAVGAPGRIAVGTRSTRSTRQGHRAGPAWPTGRGAGRDGAAGWVVAPGRPGRAGRLRGAGVHLRHQLRRTAPTCASRTPGSRSTSGRSTRRSGSTRPTSNSRTGSGWRATTPTPTPSADHLLGQHSAAPAVFIGVRDVPELARGQISLDLLRDLFRPVSAAAREEAAMNPASPFSGFSLMTDEVLTPGDGLRGVHVVYRYRISGGPSRSSTRSPTSTTTPASSTCSTCAARQTATSSASRRSRTWSHRSPSGRPHDPLRPTRPQTHEGLTPPDEHRARGAGTDPQEDGAVGPDPAVPAVHDLLADHRVGGDGGQPAAAVRRRGADRGRRLAVAAVAGRRRAGAPAALLRQRALVGLPPLLVAAGVRRHRAGAAPAVLRLDPVPAGPGAQAGRVRGAARAGAGQGAGHLAGAGAVPGAGAALSPRCR